ncbi:hypothetical protein BESB_039660 [Besnoitia besnoiti]|uniref:Uncharacterized protein n=1 Tax=Besnoitia besnoiti TaxID=94643 RepID=A0A2A9MG73_BESBE|nr:hypothetical protein BESB_039660 [Besnoitia besnoiti]PFH37508.1 hypothetical protein BESB_039660 [Besnoitia besnoiti]
MLQVRGPVLASARYEKDEKPGQIEAESSVANVPAVLWPEGRSEEGQQARPSLQALQDEMERCRVANEEMKRAVNDERENYRTTIRDLKLLCLTQDDAEVARAQGRFRQYYGLRQKITERCQCRAAASAESDRFLLDQIITLNAELELALAEKQAHKQKRSLNGLRGQLSHAEDLGASQSAWSSTDGPPQPSDSGLEFRMREELLLSVTSLQQENQRLHEENVQIRRALAARGKTQGPSRETPALVAVRTMRPLLPPTATETETKTSNNAEGRSLIARSTPRRRTCAVTWSRLLRGRQPDDEALCQTKVQQFLERASNAPSTALSHADLAKGLLAVFRNTEEKMKYYRRRNKVLQTKLVKQRLRGAEGRSRGAGEAEIGDEAFSLEWKVGTLEAEIRRLRRLLELSAGASLSLATIHSFFLEQRQLLQRQLESEQADIDALEDQFWAMKEMRLECFAGEADAGDSDPGLSGLLGDCGDGDGAAGTQRGGGARRLPSKIEAMEEAFLAAYEGIWEAAEAFKTRHAQTAARLAQIHAGLVSVERDLKMLDREQRSQIESHMQDLADAGAEVDGGRGVGGKPCYVRQTVWPACADREAQTDNTGIASRRQLYTGEFAVNDSTSTSVTVSIINEEDIVVKLMLEDMEFPPCLYTAVAAIRFPEGSRTGEAAEPATADPASSTQPSPQQGDKAASAQNARRDTRRNVMKRRRLTDETDGKLIANMLEVEYVRGTPCLILKGQQDPATTSQDARPRSSYKEDCVYNDKLAFCFVLPVFGSPLVLLMIQCAKRRYGMLFFHLCMYNSLTGWVKYTSLPSKEVWRRFGYPGDRQLLDALGVLKRRGKVAEAATVSQIMRLFEEAFASDAKAAATAMPAAPIARPFEPEVIVLCGFLTLGEKTEILKEQQIQAAKLRQANQKPKRTDAQRPSLAEARTAVAVSPAQELRSHSLLSLAGPGGSGEEEKLEGASTFLQLKICIDWDCYLDVSCEFEE